MTDRELLARCVYTLCGELSWTTYRDFPQGYLRVLRAAEGLRYLGCDMDELDRLAKDDGNILRGRRPVSGPIDCLKAYKYARSWLKQNFPGCDLYDPLPKKS